MAEPADLRGFVKENPPDRIQPKDYARNVSETETETEEAHTETAN